MIPVYEKEYLIGPGLADSTGKLGYHETFRLFMDMAANHAALIGVGLYDMGARDMFWLTVKTKAIFGVRPPIGSTVLLRTFPEKPERIRGCRSYEVIWNGSSVIRGKTEWAVMNTAAKRLVPMKDVYPEGLEFGAGLCPEPFCRIEESDGETYLTYRVGSSDVDVGGHMNNAAYVRAMLGSLSSEELFAFAPRTIDVAYRASCYEGETLEMKKRRSDAAIEIGAYRNGECAVLIRLEK